MVDITPVNTLELCKQMWYNMGQGKQKQTAERRESKVKAETEKSNGEENRGNAADAREYKRNAKGQFTKGTKGGNPTGRPKMPLDAKQRLISMLPAALDTVQEIISDPRAKPETRMRAAEIVLERNLGKAVTPVLTETVGEGSTLTLSEMIACAKELLEQ